MFGKATNRNPNDIMLSKRDMSAEITSSIVALFMLSQCKWGSISNTTHLCFLAAALIPPASTRTVNSWDPGCGIEIDEANSPYDNGAPGCDNVDP